MWFHPLPRPAREARCQPSRVFGLAVGRFVEGERQLDVLSHGQRGNEVEELKHGPHRPPAIERQISFGKEREVSAPDFIATIAKALGMDPKKPISPEGERLFRITDPKAEPIVELLNS